VQGGFAPEEQRTDAQRSAIALATTLADELIDNDAILLAIPLYNWGVAAHVKSWYDVTYTDARIKQGALAGKPVVLASVLGGDYREESGKASWDHSTPWLRHVIENIWKADLLVVQRQLTLVGVNPALDGLKDDAVEVHAAAAKLASEHGRRDGGPGIPPEHLERIWEPDFTTKSRGTGLGLALVKQIAEHRRGSVLCREQEGGGCVLEGAAAAGLNQGIAGRSVTPTSTPCWLSKVVTCPRWCVWWLNMCVTITQAGRV